MSLNAFWHGDMRLLDVFKISYVRHLNQWAWKIGDYGRIATEIGAKNALATKASDHIDNWIDFTDPVEAMFAKQLTSTDKEKLFREKMIADQEWLFNR